MVKKYKAKYKFQRKRGEKRMKSQKGITLIALVITIIVLLILAGVTIAMLTGENGILNKATGAVSDTEKATAEEAIKMEVYNNIATNEGTFDLNTFTSITTNSDYEYAVGNAVESKRVVTVTKDSKTIGTWSVDDKGAVTK